MNIRIVGLSSLVAAVSTTVITASACAFVSSGASIELDPFQSASIMTANAKVRVVQLHSRTASTCPNNPEIWDPRAPVCLRG
jgi:hypothetical protein